MYFDVLCVQDSNILTCYEKNIEKFSFFKIYQKVKLLDPINVLQTHINMAFAQILRYNSTLHHLKHKRGKIPTRDQKP